MRQKSMKSKEPAEKVVRYIRRRARRQYSSEENIGIVLDGLRGEESIAGLCRRKGIAEGLYYSWSKEFLKAGKKRLDTSKNSDFGSLRHDLTVPARLTVVFPGVFALA